MADYVYTGVSIYVRNFEENRTAILRCLYEMADYVAPLDTKLYETFEHGEQGELYKELFTEDEIDKLFTKKYNRLRYNDYTHMFYIKPYEASSIPEDKLSVQLELKDDMLYLYLPIVSKHLNDTVLQPVLDLAFENLGPLMEQVSAINVMEYEDYADITPKVIIRKGQRIANL